MDDIGERIRQIESGKEYTMYIANRTKPCVVGMSLDFIAAAVTGHLGQGRHIRVPTENGHTIKLLITKWWEAANDGRASRMVCTDGHGSMWYVYHTGAYARRHAVPA